MSARRILTVAPSVLALCAAAIIGSYFGYSSPSGVAAAVGPNDFQQAAPPNDDCVAAQVIPAGGPFPYVTTPVDMTNANTALEAAFACTTSGNRSVWYTFTPAASGNYKFSTCQGWASFNTLRDTILGVYSGACGALVSIGCDDDDTTCLGYDGLERWSTAGAALTAGTQYFIQVAAFGSGTTAAPVPGFGIVQLSVDFVPPPNDNCSAALALTLNTPRTGVLATGDAATVGFATNDYQLPAASTCFAGIGQVVTTAPGPDAVYSFIAPNTGNFSFRVHYGGDTTLANLVLYVASTCPVATPGTPVDVPSCLGASNRNTSFGSEAVMCMPLTVGQQVFVFVDQLNTTAGSSFFEVEVTQCVTETESNNTPDPSVQLVQCGIEGSITPAADIDFYRLPTSTAGERVFAVVDGSSSNNADFDLRVTNSTDTLEFDGADNDVPYGGTAPNIAGTVLTGVQEYLRVTTASTTVTAEPYRLYYVIQPPSALAIPESEPNDSIATANANNLNYFTGAIGPPGGGSPPSTDMDVFAFTAAAGDLVHISVSGDPARDNVPFNSKVELLNSAGGTLRTTDDSNATSTGLGAPTIGNLAATSPASPGEVLVHRIVTPGTYYVRITSGCLPESPTSTVTTCNGDYLLSIAKNCAAGDVVGPTPTPPPATATPDPEAVADVSMQAPATGKTDSPDPVIAGNNLTYSLSAINNGPDTATDVSISDPLPANVRFLSVAPSAGGSCTSPAVGQPGTVTCTWFGPTTMGTTRSMTIVTRVCPNVTCNTVLTNTATASTASTDPIPTNNSSTATTLVQTQSNLSVTKTDTPDPVLAGNNLTYVMTVSNLGPSNSSGTVLVDTLPPNTTFQSFSSTFPGAFCSAAGQVVTCQLGTVGAANQCGTTLPTSGTVTIVVNVAPETPSSIAPCTGPALVNTATVSSTNCLLDPVPGNNTATAVTAVRAGSDVVVDRPDVVDTTINEVVSQCLAPGDRLRITQSFSNTGPNAFTNQRDLAGPEYEMDLPAQTVGQPGACRVLDGGGTCTITSTRVEWNGAIPLGATITIEFEVRVRGGTPFGTELCFIGVANVDRCNTSVNTHQSSSQPACVEVNCPPTIDPNSALSGQVHLPILNFHGQNEACTTWIEVQNIGDEFSKAALIVWGQPGFCPPQCGGPLKVECSGLLKPGSTWNFLGDQIPGGAKSGILFSFTAAQLSEIQVDLGFDDIVADVMCETLFFGVVGDCDDYRRFKKAYNEGLPFAGIPMDLAVGSPLAVEVLRHCPGDVNPQVTVSGKYGGLAGNRFGLYDPVFGGYAYYVPILYADWNEFNSFMYIQNGGLECSSVEIWLREQEDCIHVRICEIFTLAPGETFQFDPNGCVGPTFQGSAWLRASQPLGIVVDLFGKDVLMTYEGFPAELNFTFDPRLSFFTTANQVAYGPLLYSEYQGWDSAIQVQNFSGTLAAKVKVYFLDRSGGVVTTMVDWICPRGSQTFFLPLIADLPGNWVGSARVESQIFWSPGGVTVEAPNIGGIATLIKFTDAARSDTEQALAYNLLTEQLAFDWQLGANAGGTESGVGLIAIPSLLKDLVGTGVTTEIALANLVPKPGFTDVAIFVYDQNGLVDYVCQKLNEKQVEYIDVETWGYLNPGFKGSAIISAVFWEHEVFDETGFFLRQDLGLAAVIVERTGTRFDEDVPGDEAAGTAGIPFRISNEEGNEYFYDFEGFGFPGCPGVPPPPQPPEEEVATP
jgi:uncharacterized repeat protein (TIGR01451 family)